MRKFEIPTLLFWENGNSWYGSLGDARFFIRPEQGPESQLTVQFWRGPLAMNQSEILASAVFPLSEDGLEQIVRWLEQTAQALDLS